ncbi:MAG: hypothetical protein M9932_08410 [Xanthobacteraceae bacterium]|nr:hypothetical protein [Xanthobacteraceae bacterium]
MLKLISKFVLNVFPSVAASVIGGYIVHSYIYARPVAPAVTVSAPAWTADTARIDGAPVAMPVPVVEKAVATETPVASPQRPEAAAISSRSARGPARTASERFNVTHRGGHALLPAPQREHAAHGAMLMPAVETVSDPQGAESPIGPPIDLVATPVRSGLDRLIPPVAEMALVKRLSALSTDLETMLVSQTRSAADGVAMTAKSVFHAMMPR